LHLGQPPRTTSRIDPRSRKRLALFGALVLCLFAFVLAAEEAWAAEQPSKTTQPGTVETTTTINGKVAEPVPGAKPPVVTPPVEKPPVVTPPVEKPVAEDSAPLPPRNETQPSKENSPLPPRNETQPAEKNSPPPIDPAPSMPDPEVSAPQPVPRPAPQWFAVKTDGEAVESAPVLTYHSASDFSRVLAPQPMPKDSPDVKPNVKSDVIDPSPAPVTPAAAAGDGYASGPAPDPVLVPVPVPAAASEQVLPAASGLAGLVRGLVVAEPAVSWRHGDPPRTPLNPTAVTGLTPSTPVPTVPASVGGALRLPSSVGTTAASALGTVQSAAASVASATAEVLGTLTGNLTEPSTAGTQEDQPYEGTPQQQPAPPLAPPAGGGSFSPSTGGGQLSTGWGSAPPVMGILALLATIVLRRDFRTYLISCDIPKPSSTLLGPLERPG
jgi:hypothetical protein